MLEVSKPGFVFVLLGDENVSPGMQGIPVIFIFLVALFLVASLMVAWVQKHSWLGATVTSFIWLCAGFFARPWMFFGDQSPSSGLGGNDDPVWKILSIAWGISCLICFAVAVSIYQYTKSHSRHNDVQRRRRNRYDADRNGNEREHTGYEV